MNFADIVFGNPAAVEDALALIDDERRSVTYGQLRRRIGQLAEGMRRQGIQRGDRIAILLGTRSEYVETYLAAATMGAIAMPLNTRLAPQELVLLMRDGEPKMLIADAQWLAVAQRIRGQVPSLQAIVALDVENAGDLAYETMLAQAGSPMLPLDLPPDEPAVLLYTSGTTSGPKGTVLSHRNHLADIEQYQAFVGIPRGSVNLQNSPLYHAANIFTYVHLMAGGTTVFMPKAIPEDIFNAIEKYRVNFMFTVPTLLYSLLDAPDRPRRDLSSLQTLEYGGAPIVGPRLDSALAILGNHLQHAFGMTEVTSHASMLGKEDHRTHPGSIGRPLPHVQMRVVDDNRRPLGTDEIGELEIKGDNVTKRYWRNPAATAEAIHDGWLATGDLARRDADGYYYIVGRKKDMILSGGINIYPSDIEAVLAEHPAIAEAGVFGVPDPYWGECVVAAIVLRPGMSVDVDEVRAFTRTKLAGYKVPKEIQVVESLPHTSSGKILKRELRMARMAYLGKGGSLPTQAQQSVLHS